MPHKLRVCIVTAFLPPHYGGAELAALSYAKRLSKSLEAKVMVVGRDLNGDFKSQGYNIPYVQGIFRRQMKHPLGAVAQYKDFFDCLFKLIVPLWRLRNEFDILHNFNSSFSFNMAACLIAKALGKKIITETSLIGADDPQTLSRTTTWKGPLKPKYLKYLIYRGSNAYVSKSYYMTSKLKEARIDYAKISQIPYAVDTDLFTTADQGEQNGLRLALNIPAEATVVLFGGGVNKRKGVDLLLEAFSIVSKQYQEIYLVLAGPVQKYNDSFLKELKKYVSRENLEKKVLFTEKKVDNMHEYMQAADIFVLPSSKEGFPISIIEAMATGLAVIASDIPEINGCQVDHGENGFLFAKGSKTELATLLEKLSIDKQERKRIGENARNKAIKNWTVQLVDQAYRSLYEK